MNLDRFQPESPRWPQPKRDREPDECRPFNPLHAESFARQRLIAELNVLIGADQLNYVQWLREIEAMDLDALARLRKSVLDDLDAAFAAK